MSGTLIIFWDYDTQWGADRSRSPGGAKTWGNLEFENTEQLLELHAQYRVPACFAVVGAAALAGTRPYHDPGQIRKIAQEGHEIASHSMYHEWLPGLGTQNLVSSLRESKDALEQCTGQSVTTFVPPFNQPFDYPARSSFSLSERRQVKRDRIGLGHLCEILCEAGYAFSRVSYHPAPERIQIPFIPEERRILSRLEQIDGLTCIRLKISAGFNNKNLDLLVGHARLDDILVVYGHPHTLYLRGGQDERHLRPFLEVVKHLTERGRIQVVLPRQLISMDHSR